MKSRLLKKEWDSFRKRAVNVDTARSKSEIGLEVCKAYSDRSSCTPDSVTNEEPISKSEFERHEVKKGTH